MVISQGVENNHFDQTTVDIRVVTTLKNHTNKTIVLKITLK